MIVPSRLEQQPLLFSPFFLPCHSRLAVSAGGSGAGESSAAAGTVGGQQRVAGSTGLSLCTTTGSVTAASLSVTKKRCLCLRFFFFLPHAGSYPQVEGLRSELLRTTREKTELQRTRLEAFQPSALPHGNHIDGQEGGSGRRAPGTRRGSESTDGWGMLGLQILARGTSSFFLLPCKLHANSSQQTLIEPKHLFFEALLNAPQQEQRGL